MTTANAPRVPAPLSPIRERTDLISRLVRPKAFALMAALGFCLCSLPVMVMWYEANSTEIIGEVCGSGVGEYYWAEMYRVLQVPAVIVFVATPVLGWFFLRTVVSRRRVRALLMILFVVVLSAGVFAFDRGIAAHEYNHGVWANLVESYQCVNAMTDR